MNYKIFETERLIIKPTCISDAEFIYALMNTPKWIKYIGDRNINTIEDARNYIKTKIHPQLERLGYSNFTLILKENDQKIGVCGLYDREGLEGIDIGFAFLPEFEKRGFAFEVANKIKEAAFDEFEINTLQAITDKDNMSSQRLLEKLGFNLEGAVMLPDKDKEVLLYRIKK